VVGGVPGLDVRVVVVVAAAAAAAAAAGETIEASAAVRRADPRRRRRSWTPRWKTISEAEAEAQVARQQPPRRTVAARPSLRPSRTSI
jgi:hypothetical protein